MHLLVDAFNVLHVTGVLPPELAGIDLDGLAALVAASRYSTSDVWIVCDGRRPATSPPRRPGIAYSWSGGGRTADDWITGLVRRSSSPRTITVVTSDRAIVKAIRRRGASSMTSEMFLTQLARDAHAPRRGTAPTRPAVPLPSAEVTQWLRTFGLDESMLAVASSPAPRPDTNATSPAPNNSTANESIESPPTARRPIVDPPLSNAEFVTSFETDFGANFDFGRFVASMPLPPEAQRDSPRAPRRSRRDRRP